MTRWAAGLICALLLMVAACSDGADSGESTTISPIDARPPLATANGVDIPVIDVITLHEEFGALSSEDIADSVALLVLNQLLFSAAAEDFAVAPTQDEIANALSVRTERFETEERLQFVLSSQNHTLSRVQLEARLDAVRNGVTRHLVETDAPGFDIDRAYKSFLFEGATVCVRHIQVLTDDGYALVEGRLAAGDDFATVAIENSLDPFVDRTDGGAGTDGDLGCRTPASTPFPEAAIDAEIGVYTGPVFSSVGTHLIEVYERTAPALDDVRSDVIDVGVTTQGPDLFNQWAIAVLQNADVEIDPAFGTWGVREGSSGIPTVIPAGE